MRGPDLLNGRRIERVKQYARVAGVRASAFAFGLALFAMRASAQTPVMLQAGDGICSLPAAGTAVPTGVMILRGGLFLVGGFKAATSSNGGGDGDYGTSSKRKGILLGLGVMAVGALFPELMDYVLELTNTSASAMGLGCAW